jgi:hypothetical protein
MKLKEIIKGVKEGSIKTDQITTEVTDWAAGKENPIDAYRTAMIQVKIALLEKGLISGDISIERLNKD